MSTLPFAIKHVPYDQRGPLINAINIQEINIHETDNIYYNVVINHPPPDYSELPYGAPASEADVDATYMITRDIPILGKASEYYVSVIRFDIPLDSVPIMIMPVVTPQIVPGSTGQVIPTDPNLTPFIVGIQWVSGATGSTGGVGCAGGYCNYLNQLEYIHSNSYSCPPVQNQPGVQVITPYYFVYSYNLLIEMVNQGLAECWDNSGLGTQYPNYRAPYMIYSPDSVQLIVPDCFVRGATIPIIYMNLALYSYFSSFPVYFYGYDQLYGKDIGFILSSSAPFPASCNPPPPFPAVRTIPSVLSNVTPYYPPGLVSPLTGVGYSGPTGTVITNYWQITNEYSTFALWNSLRKIVLVSNTLPIRQEGIPSINTASTGLPYTQPILADFVPEIMLPQDTRSVAFYNPATQYKLIDLTSDLPINKIDVSLYWQDKYENLFPIQITQFQSASIKLGFFRKNLYKNFRTDYGGVKY